MAVKKAKAEAVQWR